MPAPHSPYPRPPPAAHRPVPTAHSRTCTPPQGQHCIKVVAKLLANSSEVFDGANTVKMPAEDVAGTTNVCFYKSSKQASADFGFDLCSAKCECLG